MRQSYPVKPIHNLISPQKKKVTKKYNRPISPQDSPIKKKLSERQGWTGMFIRCPPGAGCTRAFVCQDFPSLVRMHRLHSQTVIDRMNRIINDTRHHNIYQLDRRKQRHERQINSMMIVNQGSGTRAQSSWTASPILKRNDRYNKYSIDNYNKFINETGGVDDYSGYTRQQQLNYSNNNQRSNSNFSKVSIEYNEENHRNRIDLDYVEVLENLELSNYIDVFKNQGIETADFFLLNQNDLKGLHLPLAARKRILNYQESIKKNPEAASFDPKQNVINQLQDKYWGQSEQKEQYVQQQPKEQSKTTLQYPEKLKQQDGIYTYVNTSANQNVIPLQNPDYYFSQNQDQEDVLDQEEDTRNINKPSSSSINPIASNSPRMLLNQSGDSQYKRYKRSDDAKRPKSGNRFASLGDIDPKRLRQTYTSRMKDIQKQEENSLNYRVADTLDHLQYAKQKKSYAKEIDQSSSPFRKYLNHEDEDDEQQESMKEMRQSVPQMHQKSQERRSTDTKYFKKIAKKYTNNRDRLQSPQEQMYLSASLKTRPSTKNHFVQTPDRSNMKRTEYRVYQQSPSFSASTNAQSPNYLRNQKRVMSLKTTKRPLLKSSKILTNTGTKLNQQSQQILRQIVKRKIVERKYDIHCGLHRNRQRLHREFGDQ